MDGNLDEDPAPGKLKGWLHYLLSTSDETVMKDLMAGGMPRREALRSILSPHDFASVDDDNIDGLDIIVSLHGPVTANPSMCHPGCQ